MAGLIGRNTAHYIGLQANKDTPADNLQQLNAKSNSLEESVDTIESEALLGNPMTEEQDVTFIYPDGDMPAELTVKTLPKLLLLAGFIEPSAPVQVTTTLAAEVAIDDNSFEPDSLRGMTPGASVTIDDETNTETVTVDYVEDNIVYTQESFTNGFASGDTITLDNKHLHTFELAQAMQTWGTIVREKPTAGSSGKYDVFTGVRIGELGFSAEKDSYIEVSPSVNGLDADIGQDGAVADNFTEVNTPGDRILSLASIVELAGADITGDVDDISLTINNNLLTDDKGLNDKKRRDLRRQDGMEITLEMTTLFDANRYYDQKSNLKEGVATDVAVEFSKAIEAIFPKTKWTDVTADTGGAGDVTVSFSASVLWDTAEGTAAKFKLVDEQDTKYEAPTS